MSMGVHHPYPLDLCAYDEDPSQLIIRPGWDAPHVRCSPRTFCAWPCLLRQVGTVLGSPYDYVVARLAYANPGCRQEAWRLGRGELGRPTRALGRPLDRAPVVSLPSGGCPVAAPATGGEGRRGRGEAAGIWRGRGRRRRIREI